MWNLGMSSNMNFPAPAAALGFLTACAGTLLSACALAVAVFARKASVARMTMAILAAGAGIYFGLLFGFSLGSHDHFLSKGQEKYFCEVDCHLAYSVVGVKAEPAAAFTNYAVTLRTRFDETTISSHRPKDAPLTPSPRTVQLMDAQGNRYAPESSQGVELSQSLVPGESYTSELGFRVPRGAQGLRLLITTTPGWPDHVVIGDENSWLHKKTYFSL